ncbi:unnamed protein product [Durusdinium trenchii]|uniref:Uncharacterized protein n=1 Tax=Durusdinium trenchii TaxID=1381693 RepID=A0ABP0LAD5_9DINO
MRHYTVCQEIVDWLRAHEATEACVVLDDLDLSPSLGKSCVIVNGQEALTDADAESAVEVLTTDAGDVSELLKAFVQVGEEMAWRHRWEMLERKAAKKKKKEKREEGELRRSERLQKKKVKTVAQAKERSVNEQLDACMLA